MARTPLAGYLGRAFGVAGESLERKVPVERVIAERARLGWTRREFLTGLGAAGVAAVMPGLVVTVRSEAGPRIAVVGAGLAGLTCAYRLQQAGYRATLYEASQRLGGRCWSDRQSFAHGQVTEHGGELIDTDHRAVRHLAQELDLELDDLLRADQGTEPLYYFGGKAYTYAEASEEMRSVWDVLHRDLVAADYPTRYNRYTQRAWQLDHISVADWIARYVPGGLGSRLGHLLDVAYVVEFGAESTDQSALNLIYLLGYSAPGRFRLYGTSDERFHIRGGNDQLVTGLAQRFRGGVQLGHKLLRVRRRPSGVYVLGFDVAGVEREVVADRVVLALPFAVMRASVDFAGAEFRPLKARAIRELGMGSSSKLQLQFTSRLWRAAGCSGETYADTGYQNTWEASRAQPGAAGILVNFSGGRPAAALAGGSAGQRATAFLAQIEPVLPGLTGAWNGRASLDVWSANPWSRGSYAYWRVGQYTGIAGMEGEPEGHCFFAGEHSSLAYQGYLNGAVESGERAASEVLASLGRRGRAAGAGRWA